MHPCLASRCSHAPPLAELSVRRRAARRRRAAPRPRPLLHVVGERRAAVEPTHERAALHPRAVSCLSEALGLLTPPAVVPGNSVALHQSPSARRGAAHGALQGRSARGAEARLADEVYERRPAVPPARHGAPRRQLRGGPRSGHLRLRCLVPRRQTEERPALAPGRHAATGRARASAPRRVGAPGPGGAGPAGPGGAGPAVSGVMATRASMCCAPPPCRAARTRAARRARARPSARSAKDCLPRAAHSPAPHSSPP